MSNHTTTDIEDKVLEIGRVIEDAIIDAQTGKQSWAEALMQIRAELENANSIPIANFTVEVNIRGNYGTFFVRGEDGTGFHIAISELKVKGINTESEQEVFDYIMSNYPERLKHHKMI